MIERIISGGQTGVDRGALDAALEAGVDCGGWCPKGRRAEDGKIPEAYPLKETGSADYGCRTERNVVCADGTLILNPGGELSGGTALTKRLAENHGKPLMVIDLLEKPILSPVMEWLEISKIKVLNVAGPRESRAPGLAQEANAFMTTLLAAAGPT